MAGRPTTACVSPGQVARLPVNEEMVSIEAFC